MKRRSRGLAWSTAAIVALLAVAASHCSPSGRKTQKANASDLAAAAQKTYVAPGDLDEYYMFASGGHSGQIFVFGLPSMRHLVTIPVFAPYPATGYGFDDESKAMLGKDLTWGDDHHPALSETKGDYDGRWLFINEMNGRIARIDLRDFKTKQILGPVANVSGNHGSSFVTPNTEYAMMATRFSIPIPKGTYAPIEKYASDYKGVVAGIKIDPKTGAMSLGWEVLMPPFDYDLGDAGKLVSDGWMFWSSYNTGARDRQARGDREPARSRLHRGRQLARGGEGGRGGQGRPDRRRQGHRSEESAGPRVPDAVRQVAARRRRLARRQVHHRVRQARGHHDGVQLREDPDRDSQQGLHRRRRRHSGPEVRVDQGRRSAGRASARCTRSSARTAWPTRRSSSTARSRPGRSASGR